MIQTEKIDSFTANCDICNKEFEHSFEGWVRFLNEGDMIDRMHSQGWHCPDDTKNCYCDKCHTINDDDELVIINRKIQ